MSFNFPLGQTIYPVCPILDGADFISGYAFKSNDFIDSGHPVIKIKNIQSGKVTIADSQYVSTETVRKLDKFKLSDRDVLIAMTGQGSVGRVGRLSCEDGTTPYLNQRVGKFVADEEKLNIDYLYYVLSTKQYQEILFLAGSGSGQPNLSPATIKSVEIPFAPYEVQCRISSILNAIDEKISLNEKTNQTLEQMAQALFKSWFVDFEPVKVKIAVLEAGGSQEDATLAAMTAISGKDADALAVFEREHPEQYAELKTTAELFPSTMQESELGEIPEGWSIKPLDGIATYQNGLALQKFRPENENDFLPVVKIAQLKKGFSDGEEKASPNIKPECIIDNGDVVFSWSGSLMVDIWCGGKAALNQHLFKVSSTKYPKWLYYKYTAHHLIEFQRIAEAKAVTMGHIKREHLSQAKCLMPSSETVHAFTPFFEPVLNKVISNRLETRKLENIRDTLLPKLLSGEITLPEAEQAVSEVENV
ncbi:restriction endonuclease subunit S [Escherichia coli]|uniref:restriction endonuclease subunit S n=1 Tax=Escherichia coli TaxID=562 RepID=UPI00177DB5DA|nr:restriction endonuclease subunit S [Escherichia coli]MBE0089300.1 restriction endonuclease subunit S [Escherichia coli]HBC5629383.1 restriction endonuclease subunit S [Escherichia coli]